MSTNEPKATEYISDPEPISEQLAAALFRNSARPDSENVEHTDSGTGHRKSMVSDPELYSSGVDC